MEKPCLCARCAGAGKTCCQGRDIYLTPGDVGRIVAHAGRIDFYEMRAPADAAYLDQDDDPLWRDCTLAADGRRRVLRLKDGGDCGFLGAAGCVLPMNVRPLVCRLHPFDYDARGLKSEPSGDCPRGLLEAGEDLFASIGMNIDQALAWRDMLYEEILEEQDAHRFDLRPAV